MMQTLSLTVLQSIDSHDFLHKAFDLLDKDEPLAINREDLDLTRMPGLKASSILGAEPGKGWAKLAHVPRMSDAPAQIVFSSGTTGRPKAIILSHWALADVVERLNAAMEVTSEIREYIGVPVTYSFGYGRARAVSAAGGSLYLPPAGFDPYELRDMIAAGEVNAVSAVPSLWRVVLGAPELFETAGPSVRWIEIGSQFMAASEKAQMVRLFPNARILQHYGLTEASRSTFLRLDEAGEDALATVGRGFGSAEVRVASSGEIQVRGPHVASGLLREDGSVARLADEEGWLGTGDLGRFDAAGGLIFLGREDDRINLSGIKIGAEDLERELRETVAAPANSFAIAPIDDLLRGQVALLALEPAAEDLEEVLAAAARRAIARRGGAAAGALRVAHVAEIPRTQTNKVRRNALSHAVLESAKAETPTPGTHAPPSAKVLTDAERRVSASWSRVLGGGARGPDETFYDAGGDSLAAMQASLSMSAQGLPRAAASATLSGATLREVALIAEGTDREEGGCYASSVPQSVQISWGISAARGLAALLILVVHWLPGVVERLLPNSEDLLRALNPIFRFGTPSFALIFGVGVGFSMLPRYRRDPTAVRARSRVLLVLVGGSWFAISLLRLWQSWLETEAVDGRIVAEAFYSVLAYYSLALAALPLFLAFCVRVRPSLLTLWTVAATLWLLGAMVEQALPAYRLDGLLEWPRLMLIAGYNVFYMTALVCIGTAIGADFALRSEIRSAVMRVVMVAVAASLMGLAILSETPASNSRDMGWSLIYVGVFCTLMAAALANFANWTTLSKAPKAVLRGLVTVGALALPIYALHAAVIPVKDLLIFAGLPFVAALGLPMGLFFASMIWIGLNLDTLTFGKRM